MKARSRLTALGIAASFVFAPLAVSQAATGPEVFRAQACTECHTVTAASIALDKDGTLETDLSKVGATYDKKWIARFLLKKVERKGELHKKKFRGEKADLKTIAIWLESLK